MEWSRVPVNFSPLKILFKAALHAVAQPNLPLFLLKHRPQLWRGLGPWFASKWEQSAQVNIFSGGVGGVVAVTCL
jgi:hypothetical protein